MPVPSHGNHMVIRGMPRYYEELFKLEDPLSLEEIKAVRQKFMEEHGDEYTPERLYAKYEVKKAQTEMLKRSL